MRILIIGGTGTISSAISTKLLNEGHELWLVNRGNHPERLPQLPNLKHIKVDINDEQEALRQIGDVVFDSVCEFIGFVPEQVERDYRLFAGRTRQLPWFLITVSLRGLFRGIRQQSDMMRAPAGVSNI